MSQPRPMPAVRGLDRLRTRAGAVLSALAAFAAGVVVAYFVTRVG